MSLLKTTPYVLGMGLFCTLIVRTLWTWKQWEWETKKMDVWMFAFRVSSISRHVICGWPSIALDTDLNCKVLWIELLCSQVYPTKYLCWVLWYLSTYKGCDWMIIYYEIWGWWAVRRRDGDRDRDRGARQEGSGMECFGLVWYCTHKAVFFDTKSLPRALYEYLYLLCYLYIGYVWYVMQEEVCMECGVWCIARQTLQWKRA